MQFVWEGNWLSPNGHATVTRGMVRALRHQGQSAKLRTTWMPNPKPYAHLLDSHLMAALRTRYVDAAERVRIMHQIPTAWHREDDALTIGWTYTEATDVPDTWKDASHEADVIVVASTDGRDAWQRAGLAIPIWVIPHGVDPNVYKPAPKGQRPKFRAPKFRFLSVFEWMPRKGHDILLQAFWEEFSADEDVCLVLKTRWFKERGGSPPAAHIRQLKRELGVKNAAPVLLCQDVLSESEMVTLYQACSALVLPTCGEAIGLPLLEAGGCRIPVIVTGWGGQMSFLNEDRAFLVDYTLQPVGDVPTGTEGAAGFWAKPDILSLKRQMRSVYQHQGRATRRASRLRDFILQQSTWDAAAKNLVEHVHNYLGDS